MVRIGKEEDNKKRNEKKRNNENKSIFSFLYFSLFLSSSFTIYFSFLI